MLECRYEQVRTTQVLVADEQVVFLEGELVLPDVCREVRKIYSCRGYLGEIRGELDGKSLSLSGQVEAHLTYEGQTGTEERPEYGYTWQGPNAIVFAEKIVLPEVASGQNVEWDWDTELLAFSMEVLSGRKVRFHAEVGVKFKAGVEKALTYLNNLETEARIETVTERIVPEELVASVKGSKEVNNQYQISYPKAPIARIIGSDAKPVGVKAVASKGRVTIEGFLEVNVVYVSLGADGEESGVKAVNWNQQNGGALPFQIVLEEPRAQTEQVSFTRVWVESLTLTSPHPEVCRLQAVLGAKAELLNTRTVQVIVEATVEAGILDVLRQDCEVEEIVGEAEKVLRLEKNLTLPTESPNLEEILMISSSRPRIIECQADTDRVFLEGEVYFTLLYLGEGETDAVLTSAFWGSRSMDKAVFGEFIDLPGVEEGMSASVYLEEDGIDLEIMDERSVKVSVAYRVRVTVKAKKRLSVVRDCALVTEDERPKPSMLFYFVQKGDNLWKVARRYNTTMKAIAEANNLPEEEELVEGRKLLIHIKR
ncbi:MAG TPA: SPOCS domain-containing protein [Bacillota bacterium]